LDAAGCARAENAPDQPVAVIERLVAVQDVSVAGLVTPRGSAVRNRNL
jgi:hypothetical protein